MAGSQYLEPTDEQRAAIITLVEHMYAEHHNVPSQYDTQRRHLRNYARTATRFDVFVPRNLYWRVAWEQSGLPPDAVDQACNLVALIVGDPPK